MPSPEDKKKQRCERCADQIDSCCTLACESIKSDDDDSIECQLICVPCFCLACLYQSLKKRCNRANHRGDDDDAVAAKEAEATEAL